MTSSNDIPILTRPAFFSGQQLRAGDLDAVTTYHRELSWLHNRSLHNWGIATGYSVTGAAGEREVRVSTGFALDCQGRELILTSDRIIAVPAVAGDAKGNPAAYFLTVSWRDDVDLDAEIRGGVCATSGAVRRPEDVALRWQDPDDRSSTSAFRPGLDVVLASVEVQRCRLAVDASSAERRNAMPEAIPYVFAGQTPASQTIWRLWPDEEEPVGVACTVSTAEAGFGASPRYLAHVVGARLHTTGERVVVIEGYPHVAAAAAAGFELRVILPEATTQEGEGNVILNPADLVHDATFPATLQSQLGWHVVWVGVEG